MIRQRRSSWFRPHRLFLEQLEDRTLPGEGVFGVIASALLGDAASTAASDEPIFYPPPSTIR